MSENLFAPTEFKFADSDAGNFAGYASVFGVRDSHRDIVRNGAFGASLAEHRARGTMPGMYVEHSAFTGGDPLPLGRWHSISEDDHGLRVKGRLSALDTDHGKRVRSLMQDGALPGLSIVYKVRPGGSEIDRSTGTRHLKAVHLNSIDIVSHPSNPHARVDAIKSAHEFGGIRDLEDWLHEQGLSIKTARRLASGGYQAIAGTEENEQSEAAAAFLRKIDAATKSIQNLSTKGP